MEGGDDFVADPSAKKGTQPSAGLASRPKGQAWPGIDSKKGCFGWGHIPKHRFASGAKQRIEPALVIETRQIIKTADMHLANEYLRDGSALGSLHHFRQVLGRFFNVYLVWGDALAR